MFRPHSTDAEEATGGRTYNFFHGTCCCQSSYKSIRCDGREAVSDNLGKSDSAQRARGPTPYEGWVPHDYKLAHSYKLATSSLPPPLKEGSKKIDRKN